MKYTQQNLSAYQRGNVLFLVLVAVALFAALSYAVTQSSKGVQQAPVTEENNITAAQMTQLGDDLQESIQAMTASGTSISNIQLHDSNGPGTPQTNVVPCTSGANCLFSRDGGGASFPVLPAGVTTSVNQVQKGGTVYPTSINLFQYSDGHYVTNVDGGSASRPQLILVISPIQQALCLAINKQLGISPMPTGPTAATSGQASINGFTSMQWSGCWYSTDNAPNYFYSYFHIIGAL